MAIVVYRCDTCKREIELQRNIEGLEHVGRCNITHGCRGKLYQVRLYPDFVRGTLPDPVSGLDDWKARKVLHNHEQAIERDEWIIEHGMGVLPIVSVFGDRPIEGDLENRVEVTPTDIVAVTDNIVRLVFDRPWSGMAQLVARQSDPDLLQPAQRVTIPTVAPLQLTTTGEFTIATRIDEIAFDQAFAINVTFHTPNGIDYPVSYAIDTAASLVSPWSDYKRVVIKGNIYTIRSFNAIVPDMTTGVIASGSTFTFDGIDLANTGTFSNITPNTLLMLMATAPFEEADKITDKFIDVTAIPNPEDPTQNFFFNNGEFFSEASVATSVYPLIRNV